MKFQPYERDVLETIELYEGLRPFELSDQSGWEIAECVMAVKLFRHFKLIYKDTGGLYLTEKGKILLAILRGQDNRKRSKHGGI